MDDPTDPTAETPVEALREALAGSLAPLAAAAELTRRGDLDAARCLAAAAAFATPQEILALGATDDVVVSDALGAGVLSATLAPASREACATALETAGVSPAALAALAEVAEGPKRPPWAHAGRALECALARSALEQRLDADRLRHVAKQLRAGEGGSSRRIAYQRDIARGVVHPVVAAMVDVDFLCGVVAPMDDAAAPALVPIALLAARSAPDALRGKALALIQRRWSAVAAPPLSAAVRASARPKDEPLRAALLATLGALGAAEPLARCAASCAGATRAAALTELARVFARAQAEVPEATLRAALAQAEADPDEAVASLARSLTARLAPC
ncbi:MAG: hypothetical protein R3A48_27020 [Polyangiales bacterium]